MTRTGCPSKTLQEFCRGSTLSRNLWTKSGLYPNARSRAPQESGANAFLRSLKDHTTKSQDGSSKHTPMYASKCSSQAESPEWSPESPPAGRISGDKAVNLLDSCNRVFSTKSFRSALKLGCTCPHCWITSLQRPVCGGKPLKEDQRRSNDGENRKSAQSIL